MSKWVAMLNERASKCIISLIVMEFTYDLNINWNLGGGYWTLERGVDNDDVYNSAWLHYAFLSLGYRF
ncbi:MAG: hypothetical protein QNI91_17740 [Arenicellales bacterium]|nr:hypothetical protein [Arenicellales bacterium]